VSSNSLELVIKTTTAMYVKLFHGVSNESSHTKLLRNSMKLVMKTATAMCVKQFHGFSNEKVTAMGVKKFHVIMP
jgi:hypothetical protein